MKIKMIEKSLLIESLKHQIEVKTNDHNRYGIGCFSHQVIALDQFLTEIESGKFDVKEGKDA